MLAYILNRDVQERWNASQPTGGDVCQSFHGLLMWRNRSVVMVKDVPQKHEPLLWPRCSLASPSQALFAGCGTMNGLGEPSTGHAPSFLSTLTNPGWFYVYVRSIVYMYMQAILLLSLPCSPCTSISFLLVCADYLQVRNECAKIV
jgi:hypothetical protein